MRVKIVVQREGRPVRRCMLLLGQTFEIGRGRDVDIRLKGLAVSRRHTSLRLSRAGLVVQDLGSRNGTQLGDETITPGEPILVPSNGVVHVGPYAFHHTELPALDQGASQEEQKRAEELLRSEGIELRYRIGRGSAGTVWVGWSEQRKDMVAVKILDARLANESGEDRRRFLREARVCARIDSPNVVRLLDFRIATNQPLLVMEFVPGLSAMERLREGLIEVDEALEIGEHLARALASLNAAGVVHRDIKPSNILLSADGLAKLSDFGIARDLQADTRLTQPGVGLGTLAYMAPEQFEEARFVEHSADVYSLGATIYHLIAGRPPFLMSGVNFSEAIERIRTQEPPPLHELRDEVHPEISEFVRRMIARKPGGRPHPARFVETTLHKLRMDYCQKSPRAMLWDSNASTETHDG